MALIKLSKVDFKKGFDDWEIEISDVVVNTHWIHRVIECEQRGKLVRKLLFTDPRLMDEMMVIESLDEILSKM